MSEGEVGVTIRPMQYNSTNSTTCSRILRFVLRGCVCLGRNRTGVAGITS